jgi:hypothetical protein
MELTSNQCVRKGTPFSFELSKISQRGLHRIRCLLVQLNQRVVDLRSVAFSTPQSRIAG